MYQWIEAVLEELQENDGSEVFEAAAAAGAAVNDSLSDIDALTAAALDISLREEEDMGTGGETCPEIHTGPPIEDRKSVFQGHFAAITSSGQVPVVLAKLKSNPKIGRAFHNMWAYR